MNHSKQENQTTPGGKPKRPENVPSYLEEQAQREQQADSSDYTDGDSRQRQSYEREARQVTEDRDAPRNPQTDPEKFGKDMPREQQANPARKSDDGARQHDVRRDLPGVD